MIVYSITLSQITWVDGFQVLFTRGLQNPHVIVDFALEHLLTQTHTPYEAGLDFLSRGFLAKF